MSDAVLLYTTWPDPETAAAAGAAVVEVGLAACVNILGPMTSIYRRQGAVERATETSMIVKTTAAAAPAARDFLVERHPYDVPAVVALPVSAEASHPAFLQWIDADCASR